MAKKSKETKHDIKVLWSLRVLDGIILGVPLLVYFVLGLLGDGVAYQKLALVGTFAVALILTIFNIIAKKRMRSAIWIAIIGLYVAIDNLIPLILCIATATIIDEFVISPLIENYKMRVISNKTIDRRGL